MNDFSMLKIQLKGTNFTPSKKEYLRLKQPQQLQEQPGQQQSGQSSSSSVGWLGQQEP